MTSRPSSWTEIFFPSLQTRPSEVTTCVPLIVVSTCDHLVQQIPDSTKPLHWVTWSTSPWSHLHVTGWPSRAPSKHYAYMRIHWPLYGGKQDAPPSWCPLPVLVIASPHPRGEWGPQLTLVWSLFTFSLLKWVSEYHFYLSIFIKPILTL